MADKQLYMTIFFITCKESITFSDYLHAAANAKHLLKEQFNGIPKFMLKPSLIWGLVRAFLHRKKVSGASSAGQRRRLCRPRCQTGSVSPPLMLFHIFSCSPRRQPTKQRCFAPQRGLRALTNVNIGFKTGVDKCMHCLKVVIKLRYIAICFIEPVNRIFLQYHVVYICLK